MEIEDNENANTFLDDSDDTNETPIKTQNKKENKPNRYEGVSNTIRLSPIIRGFTESHIYEFIVSQTNIKPSSMRIMLPKRYPSNRISHHKESPLYDACNAFIAFNSSSDASIVSNKLNGISIPNTDDIEFKCSVTSEARHNINDLRDNTNWISITNLSKDISEQKVLTHIQNNSGISDRPTNIYLYHNEKPNYTGHAIIECASTSDANKCVENLRLTTLGESGNKIWCTWRPTRKEFDRKEEELGGKTKQILLGNLHYTLKQNDILGMCSKYGQVNTIDIWYDKSGYTTGCASVTMVNSEDAKKLFDGLNGEKVKNLKIITAYSNATKKRAVRVTKKKGMGGKRGSGRGRRGGGRGKRGRGGVRMKGRRDGIGGRNKMRGGGRRGRGRGRGRGRSRGRGRGRGPKFA